LIVESFIGLCKEGDKLQFNPCLPLEWNSVKVHYRYGESMYHLTIQQHNVTGETTVTTDGVMQNGPTLELVDDQKEHDVLVVCYSKASIPGQAT
jgi:cellobiose phosphorylase